MECALRSGVGVYFGSGVGVAMECATEVALECVVNLQINTSMPLESGNGVAINGVYTPLPLLQTFGSGTGVVIKNPKMQRPNPEMSLFSSVIL